jgi:hypothetical protein
VAHKFNARYVGKGDWEDGGLGKKLERPQLNKQACHGGTLL